MRASAAVSHPEITFLVSSHPLACWLCCEWCIYGEVREPMQRSQHPGINSADVLSCFGSARGCASHMSRSPSLCVSPVLYCRPSFHLSLPAYPVTRATCLHQISICCRSSTCALFIYCPFVCGLRSHLVMTSHFAEISADVGNLSAWE